jgi:hypothetical protein
LEIIAAVAIGLNPYVGALVLSALAAFSGRVPMGPMAEVVPPGLLVAAALLAGLAAPIDFVLGKFTRFAPQVRRYSQLAAPLSGALFAVLLSSGELPLPLVAVGGALVSWCVAAMLTSVAARASRSAAWIGLGHIPVLMGAATTAACMVPLGVAKSGIGYALAAAAFSMLAWAVLAGRQASQPVARRAADAAVAIRRAPAR